MHLLSILWEKEGILLPPLVEGQQYCEHTTLVMWWLVYTVHLELIYILCPSVSSIQTCHLERKNRHIAGIAGDRHDKRTRRPVWFRQAKLTLAPVLYFLAQSFFLTHEENWLVLLKKKKKSLPWQRLLFLLCSLRFYLLNLLSP